VTYLPTPTCYDTFTRSDGALGSSETTGPDSQATPQRTWTTIGGDLDIASNAVQGGDAQTELVQNSGVESFTGTEDDGTSDDFDNWLETPNTGGIIEAVTGVKHGGSYAVKLTKGSAGNTFVRQTGIAVTAAKLYWGAAWVYGDGGTGTARMALFDSDNVQTVFTVDGATTAAWQLLSAVVAAPTGCSELVPYIYARAGTGDVCYADDFSLVECHAEYIDVGDADVQIVANVTTPASGTAPFGLILRRNGAIQWLVQITPGTAGTDLELIELDDGAPTSRANADVDWTADTQYEIQVSCSGDDINVYVDNAQELTYGTCTVGQANTQFGYFDSAEGNATLDDILIFAKDSGYDDLSKY